MAKKIGTHSGNFHCDEALACYLLLRTKEFANAEIIRSRDPKVLNDLDILVDVGAVYDPTTHRYDHHQRGFEEVFSEEYQIKLSSAGLVYKHFGKEILFTYDNTISEEKLELLYKSIYERFVMALDAIDNGISRYDTDQSSRYDDSTCLASRINRLNPSWNEDNSPEIQMNMFRKAMKLAGSEFDDCVERMLNHYFPAQIIVEKALDLAKEEVGGDVHAIRIIELCQVCPWKKHLYEIEIKLDIPGQILYTIYQSGSEDWRIQCVSKAVDSFENRLSLPESWRGKRDEELSKDSGIADCIFVHAGGFIGGNKTREGALQMAQKALLQMNE